MMEGSKDIVNTKKGVFVNFKLIYVISSDYLNEL